MLAGCVTSRPLNHWVTPMARTQKDVVSYFPHDANSSSGDTLTVLQSRFGNDGYAFWFKLLEKLASTDGHCLDVSNPIKWHLLLAKMGVNEITGVDIMNLLVEMQAIDRDLWDSKVIWCQKLVDNIADVYKNRRREIPQMPINTNHNLITTAKKALTTSGGTQSKLNKVNKIILPGFIDKELWDDFLEMRVKMRKAPTDKAKGLLIKDLENLKAAGNDPSEVLRQSIKNSWAGVFPLKGGQSGETRGHFREARGEKGYSKPPPFQD